MSVVNARSRHLRPTTVISIYLQKPPKKRLRRKFQFTTKKTSKIFACGAQISISRDFDLPIQNFNLLITNSNSPRLNFNLPIKKNKFTETEFQFTDDKTFNLPRSNFNLPITKFQFTETQFQFTEFFLLIVNLPLNFRFSNYLFESLNHSQTQK